MRRAELRVLQGARPCVLVVLESVQKLEVEQIPDISDDMKDDAGAIRLDIASNAIADG